MAQIPRILVAGLSPEGRVLMWVSVTSLGAQLHSRVQWNLGGGRASRVLFALG